MNSAVHSDVDEPSKAQWMQRLRDEPGVMRVRLCVLFALGARMRPDGTGWASHQRIAMDTGYTERTVERHTRWARDHGWLAMTERGRGFVGQGKGRASAWKLLNPDRGVGIEPDSYPDSSDGKTGALSRQSGPSIPTIGPSIPTGVSAQGVSLQGVPPQGVAPAPAENASQPPPSENRGNDDEKEDGDEERTIAAALGGLKPTAHEIRLLLVEVRREGRIRDIRAWARSSNGHNDLQARLHRLRAEPNPMANIGKPPPPDNVACQQCETGRAPALIGVCNDCLAGGDQPATS